MHQVNSIESLTLNTDLYCLHLNMRQQWQNSIAEYKTPTIPSPLIKPLQNNM
jgi:hypothetical protein